MAKKKPNRTASTVQLSETEKMIIARMNQTLNSSGMNKSTFAKNLQWGLSRLSKILNEEQKLSLTDASDMAQALGYPLDAFMQLEFDLDEYEQTHDMATYTLGKCIDDSLSWLNDYERFKECVLRQFPRTIKKVLGISGKEFVVEGEINQNTNTFIKAEGGFGSATSFKPQITVRYKGVVSKSNDFLTVGYWFDEGRNVLALAICYVPDRETFSTYGVSKRNYYKSLVERKAPDVFDENMYGFADSLKAGEIVSKIYDFRTSSMDEETLINDLIKMFELYKKLVSEVAQAIDGTYWEMYNDIVTESGPRIVISPDDFAMEVKRMMRSGPRNPMVGEIARQKAGYKCECCGAEKTFTRSDGKQHFETHHLVPLAFREQGYEYDTPENVICLCPTCHSKIHYATDEEKEKMVVEFYYRRKNELADAQIDVSLVKLLKMYKL